MIYLALRHCGEDTSILSAHRTWEAAAAAARASLSGDGDVDDVMPVRFDPDSD